MFTQSDYQQALDYFENKDPRIYQLMMKHGYKVPPSNRNLFATLVGSIIGQKIRFVRARLLRRKLYQRLGTDNFTQQDIQNLGIDGLLKIGLESHITNLIFQLANHVNLDLDQLVDIKGIGAWTIKCTQIMMSMTTGQMTDILLVEDLIIRRNIKKICNISGRKGIEELMQKWSPYNTIVTWYLWQEL